METLRYILMVDYHLDKRIYMSKMLDNVVLVDGLFTYIFYCEIKENDEGNLERMFRTNTIDGSDTCKSPLGCFKDLYIPNDLKLVVDTIDKYNNFDEEEEA